MSQVPTAHHSIRQRPEPLRDLSAPDLATEQSADRGPRCSTELRETVSDARESAIAASTFASISPFSLRCEKTQQCRDALSERKYNRADRANSLPWPYRSRFRIYL